MATVSREHAEARRSFTVALSLAQSYAVQNAELMMARKNIVHSFVAAKYGTEPQELREARECDLLAKQLCGTDVIDSEAALNDAEKNLFTQIRTLAQDDEHHARVIFEGMQAIAKHIPRVVAEAEEVDVKMIETEFEDLNKRLWANYTATDTLLDSVPDVHKPVGTYLSEHAIGNLWRLVEIPTRREGRAIFILTMLCYLWYFVYLYALFTATTPYCVYTEADRPPPAPEQEPLTLQEWGTNILSEVFDRTRLATLALRGGSAALMAQGSEAAHSAGVAADFGADAIVYSGSDSANLQRCRDTMGMADWALFATSHAAFWELLRQLAVFGVFSRLIYAAFFDIPLAPEEPVSRVEPIPEELQEEQRRREREERRRRRRREAEEEEEP
jgi:hypothetical protein